MIAAGTTCVTAIAPGALASEMNFLARDHADDLSRRIPARRIGHDEDMQGVAVYLACRAGDYPVGITIPVDGGVAFANSDSLAVDRHVPASASAALRPNASIIRSVVTRRWFTMAATSASASRARAYWTIR